MMRLKSLSLLLLLCVGTSCLPALFPRSAQAAVAQGACPPADSRTLNILTRFLTSADNAPVRVQDGFGSASAANVRLLTDATDAGVCSALRSNLTFNDGIARTFTFYEANGYYFVVTVRPPRTDGYVELGFNPLIVLTNTLQVLGAYTS